MATAPPSFLATLWGDALALSSSNNNKKSSRKSKAAVIPVSDHEDDHPSSTSVSSSSSSNGSNSNSSGALEGRSGRYVHKAGEDRMRVGRVVSAAFTMHQ